ncbi:hypothetical protein ACQZV8_21235 [Magnetococcales bacterium HHB-1]
MADNNLPEQNQASQENASSKTLSSVGDQAANAAASTFQESTAEGRNVDLAIDDAVSAALKTAQAQGANEAQQASIEKAVRDAFAQVKVNPDINLSNVTTQLAETSISSLGTTSPTAPTIDTTSPATDLDAPTTGLSSPAISSTTNTDQPSTSTASTEPGTADTTTDLFSPSSVASPAAFQASVNTTTDAPDITNETDIDFGPVASNPTPSLSFTSPSLIQASGLSQYTAINDSFVSVNFSPWFTIVFF